MTISDLARYLKVSKSSLYKLAQDGRVPGQKVGKHWRFRRETIDHWLDGWRQKSAWIAEIALAAPVPHNQELSRHGAR